MLKHRVIPSLLLQDGGLVKGIKFKDHRYVGDPVNAIRIFNEKEVDELIVLDIGARLLGREPDYGLIEDIASECFMPVCYGGGITSVVEAEKIFSLGVEKVSVQTGALQDMRLVSDIAARFGSQSVIVSIDVRRTLLGRYALYAPKRSRTNWTWDAFLSSAVEAGAGEILLTSIDREGTMAGIDTDLVRAARPLCSVPLIASGGVGHTGHLRHAIDAGADAVAVGSFFVFHGPHRAVLITYPKYDELTGLLEA